MFHRLVITCQIFVFLLTILIPAVSSGEDNLVKIGVLAKRGAERCLKKWSPTADYLTGKIPAETFAIVSLGFEQIYAAIENEEVDFILANPSVYVELESWYGINRIATLKNLHLGEVYTEFGGVIFCKADRTDIRYLEDLKGKSFMAVEENSLGGWRAAWRELKAKRIDPYHDFSELRFGKTHDAVVYAVRDGIVDAGTIRTDTLERIVSENKINLYDFHIISGYSGGTERFPLFCSTRLYPEWPFAKVRHASDDLAEAVAKALFEMSPDDPAAITAKCAGWTIPMNYQSVHECLRELKVGPYKDLGKITLSDVIKKYWHWILIFAVLFLTMAGASIVILKLNRKIKTSHAKLRAEVAERKRAEEVAEAATEAKSGFLAHMSHEIRNPMNAVVGASDLALSEELPPKIEHYLRIIHSSAYSLLGIINDILDFSKIEAGKLDLDIRPFSLDEVLDRVTDMFLNRVAEKGIELLIDIDLETPRALSGDSLRLQQIITNLVSNAVKFTEKRGVILLGIKASEKKPDQAKLTFSVKDTGVGITAVHLAKLFRPFAQADKSTTRKYGGTGLGLCICKQLVELMDGSIWVESRLGKGSTFTFTARFGRQPVDQEQKLVLSPDIQGLNVLVVDDCTDSRLVMQKMLEAFGFRVVPISSGRESLSVLKEKRSGEEPFDLILMDWLMPELDGIKTSRIIRQELKLNIPIIMMTGFGKETEKVEAEEVEINGFLTKPIQPPELLDVIMAAFGKEPVISAQQKKPIITKTSIYKKRLRGIRILVAEDNPTNQEIALAILEKAGMVVEIAENGKAAVEAVRRNHFDAVLMDIQMPEMDGYEATRMIRQDVRFASLPIIAMTGHAMKGDEEKCLKAGMNGYVAKPINQDMLFQTIWKTVQPEERVPHAEEPEAESLERKVAEPSDLPVKLPGINIQEALSALNIDRDTFKRILAGFLRNNMDTMTKIRNAFGKNDWESLRGMAHSLKGSAGNIRADGLHLAARELERGSREEAAKPPAPLLIANVETALNQVLESLRTIVDMQEIESVYEKKRHIDLKQLMSILKLLVDALDRSDPEGVKRHFKIVREYFDNATLQDLENHVNNYEYEKALEILRGIEEDIGRQMNEKK